MALLFMDGFDKYGGPNSFGSSVAALLTAGEWTAASSSSASIVAGLSSTGYALNISSNAVIVKTLSANYPRLIGGIRFSPTSFSQQSYVIQFRDGGSAQCTLCMETTGVINLRNGGFNGTVVASGGVVSLNSIHYFEWDITFGNAGSYQCWLDGVSLFSGTGDITTTANNYANGVAFGQVAGGGITYDDLYLFDTTGSTNNAVLRTSPRVETTFPTSDNAVEFSLGAGILGSSLQRGGAAALGTANQLVLRRFVAPVASTIASISVVPNTTNVSPNHRGVIYADSGGVPGTLMSAGATVTGITAGVALTLPLGAPQSLAPGTAYWLGFMNDANNTYNLADTNTQCVRSTVTFSSGAPSTPSALTGGAISILFWGNLTAMTGNYAAIQQPVGLNSYLFDATLNHEDLYGFGALSGVPGTVHAVALKGYCQRSDSGAKTVSLRVKSGSTDSGGSNTGQTPATSFGWLTSYFPTDPNTSLPWTGINLDAATAGFKIDS